MATRDETYMRAALKCAAKGRGQVEPNPMVGAVLVRRGRRIAQGWHKRFGGPHAEIEAMDAARKAGEDTRGAALYVTLEPCCRHGKTPPCTDAVIAAGIARVVAAMEDPDPHAKGRGFRKLREAGIDVTVGVLEDEARQLLRAYCKLRTAGRPWVVCKWAQTTEGYLALDPAAGGDRYVSGAQSRAHVHEFRAQCQGILVGVGTVLADDPLLTNRSGSRKQPARVVLDGHLRIPADCRLVETADASPLIVATTAAAIRKQRKAATALRKAGAELLALPPGEGGVDLAALLADLGRRKWTYLLVEGGTKVLHAFVFGKLADELMVFVTGPAGERVPPAEADALPRFDIAEVPQDLRGRLIEERRFGEDQMLRYVVGA